MSYRELHLCTTVGLIQMAYNTSYFMTALGQWQAGEVLPLN